MGIYDVDTLISQTRKLAADYRKATGKALAVTSEIAKHDACTLLNLEPVMTEQEGGYDAIVKKSADDIVRYQIKGRAIFDETKPGQRIGQLKLDKDWDIVVLVIMNEEFLPQEIFLATRAEIEAELEDNNSKRKNRGAMSVARFKHLGRLVWTESDGKISDAIRADQADTR